jgi:hypothetical protein
MNQALETTPHVETFGEQFLREGKALVQTRTEYQTAVTVQKPREIGKIKNTLMEEANMAGERFYYSWRVKTKSGKRETVEGPSIGLARSAARLWGNCAWGATYTEDEDHYFVDGHFVDLETGFNASRPFRQRKAPDIGKYDQDRKEDIAFQIGVSKAMRNVVLNSLPDWLTEQAREMAKKAVVGGFEIAYKDEKKWKKLIEKAISEYGRFKVTEQTLVKMMGPVKSWTPAIMAELFSMIQTLRDGWSVREVLGEVDGATDGGDEKEGARSEEIEKQFWKGTNLTKKADREAMSEYLGEIAKTAGQSVIEIMKAAMEDIENFINEYNRYQKKDGDEGGSEDEKVEAEIQEMFWSNLESRYAVKDEKAKAVVLKYLTERSDKPNGLPIMEQMLSATDNVDTFWKGYIEWRQENEKGEGKDGKLFEK